jgi:3-oxoacid CoA-transferase A subunit
VAEGKDIRWFDGRPYVMERALKADFAIVKAWRGDRLGNLVYRKTAMNFNPMMATAARVTIAEVEELVEVGHLDPNEIHTPGIFVQRVVRGPSFEKRIERRTVREA